MPDRKATVDSITGAAVANRYDVPQLSLRLEQAWRILNLNQELIRSADQKSYLLIVMSTLLVTYISTNLPRLMGMGVPVNPKVWPVMLPKPSLAGVVSMAGVSHFEE